MMQQNLFERLTLKGKILFVIVSIFVASSVLFLFHITRMKTFEKLANPQRCNYYISLQFLLTNYTLLASDNANLSMIKRRLSDFEQSVQTMPDNTGIVQGYKNQYNKILSTYQLKTINTVSDPNLILTIANQAYPTVDNYYLDNRLFCVNPQYVWRLPFIRRIVRFNLAGLYYQLPDKYLRIMTAVPDDWLTGPSPGLFINNQTTTMDTRFMTGIPLLTALYILPKSNFSNLGNYSSPALFNYFNVDSFRDPLTRKILDIGGIDVFTVYKNLQGHKKFANVTPLPAYINKAFDLDLVSYINNNSYGMAYLANQITYINPAVITPYENTIKTYFANHKDVNSFTNTTTTLYQLLMKLKNKHDIILESSSSPTNIRQQTPAGTIDIQGIVGPRALFTTHCQRQQCTFIFNIAKAPGWHAFVNGKPAIIQRANFAFMAVTVPAGDAKVWFIYDPWTNILSYFISIISLLGLILLSVRAIQRRK
jgi:hypothetical protein